MAARAGAVQLISANVETGDFAQDASAMPIAASAGTTAAIYYKKMAKDTGAGYTTWVTLDPSSSPPTAPVGAWTDIHVLEKIVRYTAY